MRDKEVMGCVRAVLGQRQRGGESVRRRHSVNVVTVVAGILISLFPMYVRAEDSPFTLGISCPLSGVLAEYGTAVRNGVELARKENPGRFSNIAVVFEDSQWDPKVAVGAFRTLSVQRKVDLVFNWGNPTSEAIAPIAERTKIPTVVMSSDPNIAAGKKYIVRTINSGHQLGGLLAQEINRRGLRSLGVILAENSYVLGIVQGLQRQLPEGIAVDIIERVPLDTQDFRAVVSRIKGRRYDSLGVMLISGQISSFYRQLKAQEVTLASFGPDFLDSAGELLAAGPAVEGAFHPNFDVEADFRARYIADFGNEAQMPFAANAYDVANLVAQLFGKVDKASLSADVIMNAIRNVREYQGANGQMSVRQGEEGDYYFHYPLIIKEARSGQSVAVRPSK
jgi:ABC-type branched-subunit amino acid transport system substrate-binding protein